MLEEGYGVYVVKDASRGTNPAAQDTALRRVEQAGGVSVTALQVLLELQRDWARAEHYDEVTAIVKERCGGYGPGAGRTAMEGSQGSRQPQTQRKPTNSKTKGRSTDEYDHYERRNTNLLQGLGLRTACRLQPRLAVERRRVRGPNVLPGFARLPLHRA